MPVEGAHRARHGREQWGARSRWRVRDQLQGLLDERPDDDEHKAGGKPHQAEHADLGKVAPKDARGDHAGAGHEEIGVGRDHADQQPDRRGRGQDAREECDGGHRQGGGPRVPPELIGPR
ncbi:MAG: hypothetical protein Q8M17_07500 [Actinomycetota bacterium]|nr:hypothetical protein [Actinomycetota bacterium]